MPGLLPYMLGGLVAGFGMNFLYDTAVRPAPAGWETANSVVNADFSSTKVNRGLKSDRLDVQTPGDGKRLSVASVEVVGVRDTAIVYRDRAGNVLFQTDPVANVTLVSKGTILPEVTVRETSRSNTTPVAIEQQPEGKPAPAVRKSIMVGCDPLVSPLADPERSVLPGRCLS